MQIKSMTNYGAIQLATQINKHVKDRYMIHAYAIEDLKQEINERSIEHDDYEVPGYQTKNNETKQIALLDSWFSTEEDNDED